MKDRLDRQRKIGANAGTKANRHPQKQMRISSLPQLRRALVEIAPADYANLRGETIRRNEVPYNGYRALDAEETESPPPRTSEPGPRSGEIADLPF